MPMLQIGRKEIPYELRRSATASERRITITPELRGYASLERDAVVIGIYNRVEIWEPQAWSEYTAQQEAAFSDVQEEIFPGF